MKTILVYSLAGLMSVSIGFPAWAKAPAAAKVPSGTKAVSRTAEAEEKAPDKAPFESEEDIEYIAASAENMLGFMRPGNFVGVLTRPYAKNPSLRQAEVSEYASLRNIAIDHKSCEDIAGKLVGPLDKISLKHEKTQLFKGKVGEACEVALMDPDPKALLPDRHLFVVPFKRATYILQFKFKGNARASNADVEDMRAFIKGLK